MRFLRPDEYRLEYDMTQFKSATAWEVAVCTWSVWSEASSCCGTLLLSAAVSTVSVSGEDCAAGAGAGKSAMSLYANDYIKVGD